MRREPSAVVFIPALGEAEWGGGGEDCTDGPCTFKEAEILAVLEASDRVDRPEKMERMERFRARRWPDCRLGLTSCNRAFLGLVTLALGRLF